MAWTTRVAELGGKRVPFLRWSFVRMLLGMPRLLKHWQVGDGREDAVLAHVLGIAPAGDLDAAIAAIDAYAYHQKFLINVGDEKGAILDRVIERERPRRVLEVGAYVGYSALRIARKLPPGGELVSLELSADNAAIARQVIAHAGVSDRVQILVGTLGDGGQTLAALSKRCSESAFDVVFLDHDKDVYLADLQRLLDASLIASGSVVVADNVGFPGAPDYRAHMREQEGKRFRTVEHSAHVEYQTLIKDLVLESTLL